VHEETGLLLRSGFSVKELIDTVDSLTPARSLRMRRACEARARLFSRERFFTAIRQLTG
jgi:hypothetical protein